jgi:hypothetical protein
MCTQLNRLGLSSLLGRGKHAAHLSQPQRHMGITSQAGQLRLYLTHHQSYSGHAQNAPTKNAVATAPAPTIPSTFCRSMTPAFSQQAQKRSH